MERRTIIFYIVGTHSNNFGCASGTTAVPVALVSVLEEPVGRRSKRAVRVQRIHLDAAPRSFFVRGCKRHLHPEASERDIYICITEMQCIAATRTPHIAHRLQLDLGYLVDFPDRLWRTHSAFLVAY